MQQSAANSTLLLVSGLQLVSKQPETQKKYPQQLAGTLRLQGLCSPSRACLQTAVQSFCCCCKQTSGKIDKSGRALFYNSRERVSSGVCRPKNCYLVLSKRSTVAYGSQTRTLCRAAPAKLGPQRVVCCWNGAGKYHTLTLSQPPLQC